MKTRFDWDPAKAAANERKHGIDFDSALAAFGDPFALLQFERVEDREQRWQTIGAASGHLLLLVVHTIRETMEWRRDRGHPHHLGPQSRSLGETTL